MSSKDIEDILNEHIDNLMSLQGVMGVALGEHEGKPCIVVLVSHFTPDIEGKVPQSLAGYQVRIKESGQFRALD